MIIVLKQHAPADKVQAFCNELNSMGFQINDSVGSDTHILGLIGDTKALAESWVLANPVVETCRRVSEPYKKANRKFHPDDTIVDVGGHKIGGGYFAVMSGPCSVESKEQITYVAQRVQAAGASILRGGAFKPRTSPYTLYDEQTASFGEDEDYNQADANGFINLFGLPIAERAKLAKNWPAQD